MTDTRKVQLGTQMDTKGAEEGLQTIVQGARNMATEVVTSGARAAAGIDEVGKGAGRSAEKLDRATSSIIASIQRTTAALKAGEKNSAAYFEQLASQRGANPAALQPYLEQLRQIEAAQGRVGVSAAQTTAALRQLPAQFTDIVTSLQGGQAPLTVLLQQGGQIKDAFGGVGNALRATGGYLLGLVNPATLAAAALAAVVAAYYLGNQEGRDFERMLIQTGNAAAVTSGQLSASAQAVASLTGATVGKASEALLAMAQAGVKGETALTRYAAAAIAMERAGGPAVEKTAEAFAKLADEPLAASLKLNEAQNYLTASTYEQIKALEESGRHVEAVRVAQDALAAALEQRTPAMVQQLGYIERAWAAVAGVAKGAWDGAKSIGRDMGLEEQLKVLRERQAALNERNSSLGIKSGKASQDLQDEINALSRRILLQQEAAAAEGQRGDTVKALAAWDKEGAEYLDKQAKLAREITQARELGARAGKTQEEIEARIAAIKDKYADKDSASAANKALQDQAKLLAELAGLSGSFAQDWDALNAAYRRGALTTAQLEQAQAALLAKQPLMQAQAKELAEANKEAAKARDEVTKAYEREVEAATKSAASVEQQLQKARDEAAAALMVAEANISLAEAVERVVVARLQERQALLLKEGRQEEADAIQREIDARRELATLIGEKEARDAAKKGAEAAAKEWQRTADDMNRSLTDALLRGFESGKSIAENFRDTLKNMFNTLVLRPILQPIMGQLSSGISRLLGLGGTGTASAAGTSSSASSGLLGNLGSLGSLGSASSLGSIFSMGAQMTGWTGAGTGVALQGAGSMMANGSILQGFSQGAGAIAPWAAGAAAGIYGGRAISGGYGTFGGSGNTAVNVGTAIGAIWGPIGAAIGGAIGGLVNRAFGTKMVYGDAGIEGSFAAGDASGQNYQDWVKKGGWFRSDKSGTNYTALSDEQAQLLDEGAQAVYAQTQAWAKALALPADELAKVTSSFRLKLTDNAEENQKAIAALFTTYQEQLSGQFTSALEPFQKAGETLTDTFSRLATLQVFSEGINELGGIFSTVANASVDARESLFSLVGGMDTFTSLAQGFIGNYYSREEIAGGKAQTLQTSLAGIGIGADFTADDAKAQFRALVESTDVSTEAGRQRLATLLGLQADFASVADYMSETGKSLSEVAADAPDSAVLAPLLASGTSQQVAATNEVRDAINELTDTLVTLLSGSDTTTALGSTSSWREVTQAEAL